MKTPDLIQFYRQDERIRKLIIHLREKEKCRIQLCGLSGSSKALLSSAVFEEEQGVQVFVIPEKETAAYFFNDLENIFGENELVFHKKNVLFYPTSYKRPYEIEKIDNTNVLLRTEVLKRIASHNKGVIIVTYPEALSEKVITQKFLQKNTLKLQTGENLSLNFIEDLLSEYRFERVDFVVEPGQYAVRGGIVDVFSFTNDYPYRIEFFGDEVETIRSFNPESQLSIDKLDHITIVPNVQDRMLRENRQTFAEYIPKDAVWWFDDLQLTSHRLDSEFEKAQKAYQSLKNEISHLPPEDLFITGEKLNDQITGFSCVEFGKKSFPDNTLVLTFDTQPQPSFNKNFELFINALLQNSENGIQNIVASDNPKQLQRLQTIVDDIRFNRNIKQEIQFSTLNLALHEGFLEKKLKIACYTDHQLFERYHRFQLKDSFKGKQALTLKEIYDLQPGDYVSHIDHAILDKINLVSADKSGEYLIDKELDALAAAKIVPSIFTTPV